MSKRENELVYGNDARLALKEGIDIVANAVKVTLGAKGRNVLISDDSGRSPHITKDGVTVAKAIEVKDALKRQGALLMKEVANTTNIVVGDGTTSSTVLAQKMCNDGISLLEKGNINVNELKQGMNFAKDEVVKEIHCNAVKSTETEFVKNIATISANNDTTIGNVIAEAYDKIGKHGVISVDRSQTMKTYVDFVDGYQFDRGLITPYFITDGQKQRSVLENPYIIITDYILNRADDFKSIMEQISKRNRPVLIICDDMEFACVQDFLRNHVSGFMKIAVVKAPEFGDRRYDMLQDICTLTGAKFVSKEQGDDITKLTLDDLGEADTVKIDMEETTIVGGQGATELIEEKIVEIKALMEGKVGAELEIMEKRLGKITGGAAVIHIGAKSDVDLHELQDRVEDALNAVKASLEEGILIGGGAFLYRVGSGLCNITGSLENRSEDFLRGFDLVIEALKEPMKTILQNGDMLNQLKEFETVMEGDKDLGINVITGEIVNMFDAGIIDPAKVVRTTIENAVSVASTLLLTEVIVLGDDYSKEKPRDLF